MYALLFDFFLLFNTRCMTDWNFEIELHSMRDNSRIFKMNHLSKYIVFIVVNSYLCLSESLLSPYLVIIPMISLVVVIKVIDKKSIMKGGRWILLKFGWFDHFVYLYVKNNSYNYEMFSNISLEITSFLIHSLDLNYHQTVNVCICLV